MLKLHAAQDVKFAPGARSIRICAVVHRGFRGWLLPYLLDRFHTTSPTERPGTAEISPLQDFATRLQGNIDDWARPATSSWTNLQQAFSPQQVLGQTFKISDKKVCFLDKNCVFQDNFFLSLHRYIKILDNSVAAQVSATSFGAIP